MLAAESEGFGFCLLLGFVISQFIEDVTDNTCQFLAVGYGETPGCYGRCTHAQAAGDEG